MVVGMIGEMKMNSAWIIPGSYGVSQTTVVPLLTWDALRPAGYWWYFGSANLVTVLHLAGVALIFIGLMVVALAPGPWRIHVT